MQLKHCKLCYRPYTLGRVRVQATSRERAVLNLLGLFHWRGEPQLCLIRNLNAKRVVRSWVRLICLKLGEGGLAEGEYSAV